MTSNNHGQSIKIPIYRKKHHYTTTDKFVLNNHFVTDFDEIANEFNVYFVNIGRSLSDQIQSEASSQYYL